MVPPKIFDTCGATETYHRQAVVIGAGLAGMLAARVLADHFDRVIVLERGQFPDEPEPRDGVPQARHVHLLLTRGRQILERLFPGLGRELAAHGAQVVNTSEEIAVLNYHGWSVRYPEETTMLTFTRPLLDCHIRSRLTDYPSIQLQENCRVIGLDAHPDKPLITGVRCRTSSNNPHDDCTLEAELTVDASGRFSRLPTWLSRLGYDRPEESVVNPFLGYTSRLYERPETVPADWKALVLLGKPPDQTRGGVLLPVERERWLVTLAGINKDYPPTGEEDFLEFARRLRSPALYSAIKDAPPVSPIKGYRSTMNRLRHYESLTPWPGHLIVLGEAVCSLNPIYAQGMTVTALEVSALEKMLGEIDLSDGVNRGFGRRFQQKLARIHRFPWLMATGEDLRWPETEGDHPVLWIRLLHRYLDGVVALATERKDIDYQFSRVVHLLQSPYTLFHPRVALPVLRRAFYRWYD